MAFRLLAQQLLAIPGVLLVLKFFKWRNKPIPIRAPVVPGEFQRQANKKGVTGLQTTSLLKTALHVHSKLGTALCRREIQIFPFRS